MIQDGITAQSGAEISSFLMIGQSNMAGRGEFGEVAPIVNERCHMLRMGRWQSMSEPINPDRPIFEGAYHSGVNLCASFADAYANHFGAKVGLIPCADGGTRIAQWMPGEVLYDHAVCMTSLAKRSSRLAGILWHQGESDCNAADLPLYKERFIAMFAQLRSDLGAQHLPLIIGEISEEITESWMRKAYIPQMNRILHEIEQEVPLCKLVSTQGLALKPDGIHFNSASLRELGRRYFDAYLSLQNAKATEQNQGL